MGSFYTVTKIAEHFYHIRGLDAVNVQLVIGRERALLFDTSYGYGNLRHEVEKLTKLPLTVVNSHAHIDHINGNYRFPGPCYISDRAKEHIPLECNSQVRMGMIERGIRDYGADLVLEEGMTAASFAEASFPEFSYVHEGDTFDLGGILLKVVNLPGHTMDGIGLWQEEEGMLLAGDAIAVFPWIFGTTAGTLSDYRKTLQKAIDMHPAMICNGHAEMPFGMEELKDYQEFAKEADFEEGRVWNPEIDFPGLEADNEIRIITRRGYRPFDFQARGFASMAIGRKNFC